MVALLLERKAGLEAQIAKRFRQARATGTTANVRTLSAALRALKRQLAVLDARAASAAPEGRP